MGPPHAGVDLPSLDALRLQAGTGPATSVLVWRGDINVAVASLSHDACLESGGLSAATLSPLELLLAKAKTLQFPGFRAG